ncbi:hypothetical protein Fmac_001796 [Flemingia macrophylla]|uniref:Uncharacterized protein n=1 Tax=Flemingia macrophylla TaxID=520843 RepID=A0ABD1NI98_9FABA
MEVIELMFIKIQSGLQVPKIRRFSLLGFELINIYYDGDSTRNNIADDIQLKGYTCPRSHEAFQLK